MNAEELYYEYEYVVKATVHKMFSQPSSFSKNIGIEYDDLLQFARMGLWKACNTYTKDKQTSTFRNFAIRNVKWMIHTQTNKYHRQFLYLKTKAATEENKVNLLSMDEKVYGDEGSKNYYDVLSSDNINYFSPESVESKVMSQLQFEKLMRIFNDQEKEIISMRMSGYTYEEISRVYGITRQGIGLKINKIKNKINRYLGVTS